MKNSSILPRSTRAQWVFLGADVCSQKSYASSAGSSVPMDSWSEERLELLGALRDEMHGEEALEGVRREVCLELLRHLTGEDGRGSASLN